MYVYINMNNKSNFKQTKKKTKYIGMHLFIYVAWVIYVYTIMKVIYRLKCNHGLKYQIK